MKFTLAAIAMAAQAARIHPFKAEREFACKLCTETMAQAKAGNHNQVDRIMELFPAFMDKTFNKTENGAVLDFENLDETCKQLEFCSEEDVTDLLMDERPLNHYEHIEKVNSNVNSTWVAGINDKFDGASYKEVQALLGAIVDPEWTIKLHPKDSTVNDLPTNFDSRENWSECADVINHVRDQSNCGSCWAHGTTEALNDRSCIAKGVHNLFSVSDTTGCCDFLHCFSMGCNGGQVATPWAWFNSAGVVTGGDFGDNELCFDYTMAKCAHHVTAPGLGSCDDIVQVEPQCKSTCQTNTSIDYASDKNFASSSYGFRSVDAIKSDIYQHGTVTAAFTVYEDFLTYKSGVYTHQSGSALGGHAIKTIGWGVENGEDYWLCVNSWNNTWGDQGTFKIKMGEAGINSQMHAGLV
eukprot:CAMPEP_0176375148 /NCGR_PEP_ID=MMETSP0126-20121128/27304_1 /TAXON_ID=141414 ORGANISM="Strombidinopsis acuminatum, Strain SPMC142" /NCGR_SAMPLE_ID=MMETSP0126 /ASSEMBLY_ACC=CAM_ASM_000229 /LENGTH=409 /DNA_ID=CAMNT_0017736107 /DNA_START=62 /DNA_END=1291 /DNA_ORIENTATION=+